MIFMSSEYKSRKNVIDTLSEDKSINELLEKLNKQYESSNFTFSTVIDKKHDNRFEVYEVAVSSPKYEVGVAIFYIEIPVLNTGAVIFKPKFDALRVYTELPQDECKSILDEIQTVVFKTLIMIESLF